MYKAGKKDESKWCTIILEEYPYGMSKEAASANQAANVGYHENQEGNPYG